MSSANAILGNIIRMTQVGGEIERSVLVELLAEAGVFYPSATEADYRQHLRLTPYGKELAAQGTEQYERMRLDAR